MSSGSANTSLYDRGARDAQSIEITAAHVAKDAPPAMRPVRPAMPRINNFLAGLSSVDSTVNSYAAALLILLVLGLLFGVAYLIENPDAWRSLLGL
ncbi:MAG: hypothetical protein R2911_16435 [Caldilineaceae bacterium]